MSVRPHGCSCGWMVLVIAVSVLVSPSLSGCVSSSVQSERGKDIEAQLSNGVLDYTTASRDWGRHAPPTPALAPPLHSIEFSPGQREGRPAPIRRHVQRETATVSYSNRGSNIYEFHDVSVRLGSSSGTKRPVSMRGRIAMVNHRCRLAIPQLATMHAPDRFALRRGIGYIGLITNSKCRRRMMSKWNASRFKARQITALIVVDESWPLDVSLPVIVIQVNNGLMSHLRTILRRDAEVTLETALPRHNAPLTTRRAENAKTLTLH